MGFNMQTTVPIQQVLTQEANDYIALSREGDLLIEFAKSGFTKKAQRIRLKVFFKDCADSLCIVDAGDNKYLLKYEQEGEDQYGKAIKRVHTIEEFETPDDANFAKNSVAGVILSFLGNTKKLNPSKECDVLQIAIALAFFAAIIFTIYAKFSRFMILTGMQLFLISLSFSAALFTAAFTIYKVYSGSVPQEEKEIDKVILACVLFAMIPAVAIVFS